MKKNQRRGADRTVVNRIIFLLTSYLSAHIFLNGVGCMLIFLFALKSVSIHPLIGISLISVSVYTFDRVRDTGADSIKNHSRASTLSNNKWKLLLAVTFIYVLSLLYLFSTVFIHTDSIKAIAILFIALIPAASGVLYTSGIPYITRKIKQIHPFNTLLVSGSWATVIVFIPLPFVDSPPDYLLVFFSIYVTLRSAHGVILSDFKDIENDRLAGVQTLPVKYGRLPAKAGIIALILLELGLIVFPLSTYFQNMQTMVFAGGTSVNIFLALLVGESSVSDEKITIINDVEPFFTAIMIGVVGIL